MNLNITFDKIQKASEQIKTKDIQGKDYADVNQRIKAVRMVLPVGFIRTELASLDGGVAIFRAYVGYYEGEGEAVKEIILGTGTAYEKEGSSFINKTSFIENCETSAVGRALGMCGFGVDLSVASAEEVQNAMLNQQKPEAKEEAKAEQKKATPKQIEVLMKVYTGANLEKLLSVNGIERIEDLPMTKASDLIAKLAKKEEKQNG